MTQRRLQRVLPAALLIMALGHAVSLLDILPFRLDLGAWTYQRFFGFEWLGGVLFALLAAGWLTAFRTRAPHNSRLVRGLAAAHLLLAALGVMGGSAWQAVLIDTLLIVGLLLAQRDRE